MAKVEWNNPIFAAIAEDVKDAASVVLVDCRVWINFVAQDAELRKQLRESRNHLQSLQKHNDEKERSNWFCRIERILRRTKYCCFISKRWLPAPARIICKFAKELKIRSKSRCGWRNSIWYLLGSGIIKNPFKEEKNYFSKFAEAFSHLLQTSLVFLIKSLKKVERQQAPAEAAEEEVTLLVIVRLREDSQKESYRILYTVLKIKAFKTMEVNKMAKLTTAMKWSKRQELSVLELNE